MILLCRCCAKRACTAQKVTLDVGLLRCNLSDNHRPRAETHGMSLAPYTADPLSVVPISVPIFPPLLSAENAK